MWKQKPKKSGFPILGLLLVTNPADLKKHSVTIRGHRTSVSMEAIFWEALKAEVKAEGISLAALIVRIDETRTGNLSSALRVYVMEVLKKKLP